MTTVNPKGREGNLSHGWRRDSAVRFRAGLLAATCNLRPVPPARRLQRGRIGICWRMLQTLELPGGRRLTWREYGIPGGKPVFFFHGWPGESQQGILIHRAAEAAGVRVLSLNRPGINGSTPQPERTLLDWPPLVAGFADALELSSFRVLGLSGGGPYALACAWALGKRVTACATVCGALPAAPGPERRWLSPVYQGMLALHDHAPWLLQGALIPATLAARIPPPRPLLWLGLRALGPSDRAALWPRERFPEFFPAFQDAMRSGMSGLWEDGRSYSVPWPFDPSEIQCPVTVWHGTEDRNFACPGAAELAARIPHARFVQTQDGHYSILPNQAGPVLQDLLHPVADGGPHPPEPSPRLREAPVTDRRGHGETDPD